MSSAPNGQSADRRKLLWDLSSERRNQGRHSENLRATVAAQTVTGASVLIAVITYDKCIAIHELPLCLLVAFIGFIGAAFIATYTERYHRNRKRASDLLNELDAITGHDGRCSTSEIERYADEQTWSKKRFYLARKVGSSHWLWLTFPTVIAILGIALCVVSATTISCPIPP